MKRAIVALLALVAFPHSAPRQADPIPWAWERREDLRFLGEGHTVAYYAGLITLDGNRVDISPRRNPLLLAKDTHRIAVIRIETRRPSLSARQRAITLEAIEALFRDAEELQLDFDAARSERAFYAALLAGVRRRIAARLTITALASWCMDDRWMRDLPVDAAVPMLFRMGRDARAIRSRLARGEAFAEPRCRGDLGFSLDEPRPARPGAARVWMFNDERWSEEAWKRARQFASR